MLASGKHTLIHEEAGPYKYKFETARQTGICDLQPLVIRSRVVDQLAVLGKSGAVAGTVPGMLLVIIFQRTAHMGATGHSGGQQIERRFDPVDRQLGLQNTPFRGEKLTEFTLFPLNLFT